MSDRQQWRNAALQAYWAAQTCAEENKALEELAAIGRIELSEWCGKRGMSEAVPYAFWIGEAGVADLSP